MWVTLYTIRAQLILTIFLILFLVTHFCISAWVHCVCGFPAVYNSTTRRLYNLSLAYYVHKSANTDSTDVSTCPHIISMMGSDNAVTSTDMSESNVPMFNVVLSYTAYGMSCAKIHNVHTIVMNSFSVDELSEAKYVLWDECGEHWETRIQHHTHCFLGPRGYKTK